MSQVDGNPGEGRDVAPAQSEKVHADSNPGRAAESAILTRSGTGLDPRAPDALGQGRKQDRRQVKGENIARAVSINQQLQRQKAAVLEAAQTAAVLETKVLSAETQLKTTQQALEVQKEAGVRDAARTAVRLSLLEEELAVVAMRAIEDRGTLSKERNVWRGTAAGAVVIALTLLCLVWWRMTLPVADVKQADAKQSATQVVAPNSTAVNQPVVRIPTPKDYGLPADPHAALTMGIDRLNAALSTAPGRTPEQALRRVSANGQDCAMVWTNDLPSVLFPGSRQSRAQDPVRLNALANTLAECAEAVSRLN